MSVDLRLMRYVVAVAEEGGFQEAAKRLHVVQPALSRQIGQLERELGVGLFRRRPTLVTEAGQAFVDDARRILTAVERAVERVRLVARGEIGRVRIGCTSTAALGALPRLLDKAARDHPQIEIETAWRWDAELVTSLHDGDVDIAVGHQLGRRAELASVVLGREPLVAIVPAEHRLASCPSVALHELRGETFRFVARRLAPLYFDLVVSALHGSGEEFEVSQTADARLGSFAVDDLGGFTLAPSSVTARLPRTVAGIPLTDPLAAVDLAVLWRPDASCPPVELVVETARKLAAADQAHIRRQAPECVQ